LKGGYATPCGEIVSVHRNIDASEARPDALYALYVIHKSARHFHTARRYPSKNESRDITVALDNLMRHATNCLLDGITIHYQHGFLIRYLGIIHHVHLLGLSGPR
jgi:hypothetical protein